jgi:hypothetical protein
VNYSVDGEGKIKISVQLRYSRKTFGNNILNGSANPDEGYVVKIYSLVVVELGCHTFDIQRASVRQGSRKDKVGGEVCVLYLNKY